MKKAEPPKKAGTAKTTAKAPADASKKRFGMKGKTPPPAPRQARVRPRLSVTVLGDPSPDRPLFEDPILAQLSAADSADAHVAAPAEPVAETPIDLDWPAQPSTPTVVADHPHFDVEWPEYVAAGAHEEIAAQAPAADDFLDLSWPPAAAADAPKPQAKATPRTAKAAAPKPAAPKATPKPAAQKPASRKPAQPPAPPVMPEPALDLNWPPAEPTAPPAVPAGAPRAAKPASSSPRRAAKAPAEATPGMPALEIDLDLSAAPPIPETPAAEATAPTLDLAVPVAPKRGGDPVESEKASFAIELDLSPTPPAIEAPPAPVDIAAEMPELPAALRLGATPLEIPMDLSPTPPVPTLWTPESTGRTTKKKVVNDAPVADVTPNPEPAPPGPVWEVPVNEVADDPYVSAVAADLADVETAWPEVTAEATAPAPEPAPKPAAPRQAPKAKRAKPAPPAPVEEPVAAAPVVETPAAPVVEAPVVEVAPTPAPPAPEPVLVAEPEPVVAAEPEPVVAPAPAPAPRARRAAPRPVEAPREVPAPVVEQVEAAPAPVAEPVATPEPVAATTPAPTPVAAPAPTPVRQPRKTHPPAPAITPAEPVVAEAPPIPVEIPVPAPVEIPMPVIAAEPIVNAGPVAAPGWPEPGELTKPKAKASGEKKKATYSASRIGKAGEMENAHGEGFRPYRPIHERNIDLMEDQLADAEDLVWIERAAALWDRSATETEDRKVNWLEVRLKEAEKELRKVEARTRDEDGDLRNARKLEITEEIRRALGDDELALHFDIRVGHGRFVFSRKDAEASRPGMIRGSRSAEHEATHAH